MPHPLLTRPNLSAALLAAALFAYLCDALPLAILAMLFVFNTCLFALTAWHPSPDYRWHRPGKVGLWLFGLALGFFIALYRPEGFHYPLLYHFISLDFTLYANLGKGLAGILVITWLWPVTGRAKSLSLSLVLALLAAIIILAAAYILGVAWQVKLPAGIVWFLLINIGITVLAEEAFFRLQLQQQLTQLWGDGRLAIGVAAIVSVIFFALAHLPPDHPYFALYVLAGSLYCAVFTYTRRFAMAVITHATVNIGHFIFLAYPLS
ncbi:CPBP family intramembrane metalloprotease [Gilvimarinus agarilyticus]|uniref:CPBP family intramembrane glutamic endopeptidase n=1 Tax=Gilvimarinus sp. 2_MG-2023 TaxID=3062666 RepID=UPI001C096D48|nr:type II CAAX endopeptidase family protein [Gilvimarinus sp. 2_MG-2023]MBU2884414.1 CPBP family intramembrane metalloprotease [Gilvimarinus agarilyticus]MDO6569550.1 type II CAAX endopeptidase family protein [Gilvimarinus sp. 2_MG-2023]